MLKTLVLLVMLTLSPTLTAQQTREIKLTTKNAVFFVGEVTVQSVNELVDGILKARKTSNRVYVVVASPGGQVFSLEPFVKRLGSANDVEVITVQSASMASLIVQRLPYRRLVLPDSEIMFHEVFIGSIGPGKITMDVLKNMHSALTALNRKLAKIVAERIGISVEAYLQRIKNRDWWLSAPEALDEKVADEIVYASCSEALEKSAPVLEFATPIPGLVMQASACSLLTP